MKIETSRFGTVEIGESEVIEFRNPILGFDQFRRFVLLRHAGNEKGSQKEEAHEGEKGAGKDAAPLSFYWLQSLEDGTLAFLVIPAVAIKPDYLPLIPEGDLDLLDIKSEEEVVLLSLATVRPDPLRITANLRAPLVINAHRRLACQSILEDDNYPIRYEIQASDPNQKPADKKETAGLDQLALPVKPCC